MTLELIITLILGLALGFLIGFLVTRNQKHTLRIKIEVLTAQLDSAREQAETATANMQKQLDDAKAYAREQVNETKAESQRILKEAKEEWNEQFTTSKLEMEKHYQDALEAKEKSHTDALAAQEKSHKEALDAKEKALAVQEISHKDALEAKEKSCNDALAAQEKSHKEALDAKEKSHKEALDAKEKSCNDALTAQEKRHYEAIQAQQARFDETMGKVSAQVKSATDEMLRQRQKEFAEASNTNLGQIVTPLRETIDKMKQAMQESTLKQTAMSSEMKVTIEQMMHQSEAAKQSADELSRVFKHGSKVQGDWGETILDELLVSQGLTRGTHYETQNTMRDSNGNVLRSDEGNMLRPDVILHLDDKRDIIIDAKVSLTAFMDYVNAETEEERQQFLKAHIESIQKHVKELSAKDYSSYIRPPKAKMDYVIMFVPHSGALWTALNAQSDLWRKAMDKNVFITDEQTLFAALRIINLTWTQIAQAQNHEKVYELANEMIDRVGQFMKKYQAIGKALENATNAYEEANKKLRPGGQSILQTCAKLEKLGAKQSEKNPLPFPADYSELPPSEMMEIELK